jgi:heptosyltransferase-2
VEHHPELTEVLTFDKRRGDAGFRGLRRLAGEIRRREFALAVSLHKSYRTAALLAMSGIRRRLGFREAACWWSYSNTVRRRHLPHEVLRNLVILELLGARLDDLPKRLQIFPGVGAVEEARNLLRQAAGRPLVGIAPGSVWATKRWTEEGFRELVRRLAGGGSGIVFIGGPEDRDLCDRLAGAAPAHSLNLAGRTSIATSAAVIEQLSALVTNDSSPLHIAAAMGTPVAAIFCATVPGFGFGPWEVRHEIVEVTDLRCRTPGMVYDAVQRLLERPARTRVSAP